MTDASIPMSLQELEQIVQVVAHNLYEKWAIDDRFTEEELTQYGQYAVEDTVFVINNYMETFNQVMLNRAEKIDITSPNQLELL